MSIIKSIIPIGLYDENDNLIKIYSSQVELAKKFGVHKSTIYKYVKTGKLFKRESSKYYLKKINS